MLLYRTLLFVSLRFRRYIFDRYEIPGYVLSVYLSELLVQASSNNTTAWVASKIVQNIIRVQV